MIASDDTSPNSNADVMEVIGRISGRMSSKMKGCSCTPMKPGNLCYLLKIMRKFPHCQECQKMFRDRKKLPVNRATR